MKKFLLIIAVLIFLAAAGLALFIATFDINRYKGALESRLASVAGNPVEIGKLALSWKGQIAVEVDTFRVYDGRTKETLLSFEKASAGVRPMALGQGRLDISSISLVRPSIHIVRTPDGKITLRGYDRPLKVPGSGDGRAARIVEKAVQAAPAMGLNIASISIRDGTLRFQDMTMQPASDVTATKVDAVVKDISPTAPASFDARMALAGAEQNIFVSGTAGGFQEQRPFLRDFNGKFDLGTIGHDELMRAVPQLRAAGVSGPLRGVLTVKVRDLELAGNTVSKLSADAVVAGGRIAVAQLKAPVENLDLSLSIEGGGITVTSFSGQLANATMKAAARISDAFASPRTALQATMDIRGLRTFLAKVAASDQRIDGDLRITFDGNAAGAAWPDISRTLSGKGTLTLDRGIIVDSNMLRETLGALTLFPGVLSAVERVAPAQARQSLGADYTALKPLSLPYSVEGSYIIVPDMYIVTDFFDLRGTAKVSFTGDLSGSGMIRFAPPISNSMVTAIPQMQYLADQQGLVQFPIAFKGGSDGFRVIPDLKYIGQKVAVQAAQDAVVDLLTRKGEKQEGSQAAPAGVGKYPKMKDVLKSMMKAEE